MNDFLDVKDLLTLYLLLCGIGIVDGGSIREIGRQSLQKYEITVQLLRYINHNCNVSNINEVLQSFCIPKCDTFFKKTFNFQKQLSTCSERLKNVYPRNQCQLRETLFNQLDPFGSKYTSEKSCSKI